MKGNVYLALAAMAFTIYLVRLLPFLFLRKPIKNVFFRSFLYYVPYVTGDLFATAIGCCLAVFITGLFI